ncbi:MAG: DNA polymerase II [Candidatus Woesearchaeota archaeon]
MKDNIGFILYPTFKVEANKSYIYLFGRLKDGRSFCTKNFYEPYFFIKKSDLVKARKLKDFKFEDVDLKNFRHEEVVKVIVSNPDEINEVSKLFLENHIDCFESDIKFEYRFLIDKGIKGSLVIKGDESKRDRVDVFFDEPVVEPIFHRFSMSDFKVLSLDIETSMDGKDLYCISLVSNDEKLNKVLIISDKKHTNSDSYSSEKELLKAFRNEVLNYDPDVIVGWNVIDFDLDYLKKRMDKFDLGRGEEECSLRIVSSFMMDSKADFLGRQVLDGIHVLKSSFISLDDYKLDTAAAEFSDSSKLIGQSNKGEDIEEAFRSDKQKLIDYNLLDSKLVLDILVNSKTFDLTVLRSLLTGMTLERVRASIASMDSLYLGELRKKGFVAESRSFVSNPERTTGGFVMSPKPGIYDFVGVFDFKSLYPSIMRTFNIDPFLFRRDCKPIGDEELVKSPNNVCFSKNDGILPNILSRLAVERQKATDEKDNVARGAIKILMNSLYGVLASPNCRFYSFEMANAITGFGHKIIKDAAKRLEGKGFKVIYGDTDSVFVDLNANSVEEAKRLGKEIQEDINSYFNDVVENEYGMVSYLELEFEKLFKKMFLPKVRGSDAGAKKRYAGLVERNGVDEIEFTGLEFVRRDWTDVSKKFQLELLELVFKGENVDDYIRDFIKRLKEGEFDDLIVYKKAIRKELDKYVKTTPPHVKAARKLDKLTSNIINYVMTVDGPEPLEKLENSIDYDHYIDKQIKPLADSVLFFYDKTFDDVLKGSTQKGLFEF